MTIRTLCMLGRQARLSLAELERLFGAHNVTLVAPTVAGVDVDPELVAASHLGGSIKVAAVVEELPGTDWLKIARRAAKSLARAMHNDAGGKITYGLSLYGLSARNNDIEKTGLVIKKQLKAAGFPARLVVAGQEPALSSAQVFHNRLASEPHNFEWNFVRSGNATFVARTVYVQDIDSFSLRDFDRPRRDAKNGMLPPKLADIMLNLALGSNASRKPADPAQKDSASPAERNELFVSEVHLSERDTAGATAISGRVLDPFCGTGVVLMEASLRGLPVYGTDLNPTMVEHSSVNLKWLAETYGVDPDARLEQADATSFTWQKPLMAVIGEGFLGKPLAVLPSRETLEGIVHDANVVMRGFLKNISGQLETGTPLCIAAPAWRVGKDFRHLPCVSDIAGYGFERLKLSHASHADLLYFREDQVVARELLLLIKK